MAHLSEMQRRKPCLPTTLDELQDAEIQKLRRAPRPQVQAHDPNIGPVLAAMEAREVPKAAKDAKKLQEAKAKIARNTNIALPTEKPAQAAVTANGDIDLY